MRKWVLLFLVAGLAVAAGVYVWPTRYRDITIRPVRGVLAARQDRVTGRVHVLTAGGWRPLPAYPGEALKRLADSVARANR